MSSYAESVIGRDEKILYQGKISIWSLLPLIIFGLVTLTVFIGVIFLAMAAMKYFSTEMAITNKRIIAKHGMISRSTVELNLQKIESIQVKQGLFGRLFNYGSIVVAGAGNPQAPVPGISAPLAFRKAFIEAQEDCIEKSKQPR